MLWTSTDGGLIQAPDIWEAQIKPPSKLSHLRDELCALPTCPACPETSDSAGTGRRLAGPPSHNSTGMAL